MSTWTQRSPANIALTAAQEGGTVVFPVPFSEVPYQVLPQVIPPSEAGYIIYAVPYAITATGFSYLLSGLPGDDLHVLTWTATAEQPEPTTDDSGCSCNPCCSY